LRSSPAPATQPLVVQRRATEQVHLALGFRALDREDPDREALDVANHVLGGGMTSRLFEEIREQRGLAYAVFSSPAAYADAGTLTIYTATGPEHVDEVLRLIDGELDKLICDGITAEELDVAIGALAGGFVLGLEGTGARMGRIGSQVATLGRVIPVAEQVARYEAVTRDDVHRVLRRVLGAGRSLAAVGPVTKTQLASR
jgi:predicted Zn-dependent peptidase